jgi:ABC-type antimicrobial peptide transport system permease subunit
VAQHRREIGVRMALGATSRRIVSSLIGRSLALAAIGAATGLGIALISVRWISALLFGVPHTDPVTYAATAILVLFASAIAAIVPAIRAARTPALEAIRAE